jgi:hypothetical protein
MEPNVAEVLSRRIEQTEERVEKHEAGVVKRFLDLDFRLSNVEKQVARGAFLGVLLAEALRAGAPGIGQAIASILGGS